LNIGFWRLLIRAGRGSKVNLNGANLSGANLSGAKLDNADLSDALNVTQDQLDRACGTGTKPPPELKITPCASPDKG
jgi:uncharacterized protein YjbI with pentapeptide repeats